MAPVDPIAVEYRQGGRWRFMWRAGVLGFGLPVSLITTLWLWWDR